MAQRVATANSVLNGLQRLWFSGSQKFDGAYNISFINAYGDMVVSRDPLGIRPLSYGTKNGTLLVDGGVVNI